MNTILVVDDSIAIRQLIAYIIQEQGHQALIAGGGELAIKTLENNHVDLIITDINMPDMDGFELIEILRQSEQHQNTPIAVISTDIRPETKEKAKQYGVEHWLNKPINPRKISALCQAFFETPTRH